VKSSTPVKASESDWAILSKVQMYDFDWPSAGMFVWVHIHFSTHQLWGHVNGPTLARALWIHLTTKPFLVLVAPGGMFCPTNEIRDEKGWQYLRLCFAAVSDEEVDKSSARFMKGVESFWRIKNKKDLEGIEAQVDAEGREEEILGLGLNWAC